MKTNTKWWWGLGVVVLFLTGIFVRAAFADTDTISVTPNSGSVTLTRAHNKYFTTGAYSSLAVWTATWTSTSGGNVLCTLPAIHGEIARVVTNPSAVAPTADYDVTLLDTDGLDVLAGGGADRHTTTTQQFVPLVSTYIPICVHGALTLDVDNAGNAKSGAIKLYIKN